MNFLKAMGAELASLSPLNLVLALVAFAPIIGWIITGLRLGRRSSDLEQALGAVDQLKSDNNHLKQRILDTLQEVDSAKSDNDMLDAQAWIKSMEASLDAGKYHDAISVVSIRFENIKRQLAVALTMAAQTAVLTMEEITVDLEQALSFARIARVIEPSDDRELLEKQIELVIEHELFPQNAQLAAGILLRGTDAMALIELGKFLIAEGDTRDGMKIMTLWPSAERANSGTIEDKSSRLPQELLDSIEINKPLLHRDLAYRSLEDARKLIAIGAYDDADSLVERANTVFDAMELPTDHKFREKAASLAKELTAEKIKRLKSD